jgi:hypothetical protein
MSLRNGILEFTVCLVIIALSVVGVVSAFVTGLRSDIDGLLLILVGVLMGSLFSFTLFVLAKQQGWLTRLSWLRKRPVVRVPHLRKPVGGETIAALRQ